MESNLDGSQRPTQRLRSFRLGLSLQVAKDDGLPVFFRKPIDFRVKLGVFHGLRPGVRGVTFVHQLGFLAFDHSAASQIA
jgi:hypothetical protein